MFSQITTVLLVKIYTEYILCEIWATTRMLWYTKKKKQTKYIKTYRDGLIVDKFLELSINLKII